MKNRWRIVDFLQLKKNKLKCKVRVSTIETLVGFDEDGFDEIGFETMIFSEDDSKIELENHYQERYKTKEEAIENHKKVLSFLRQGRFNLKPTRYELELQEGKND